MQENKTKERYEAISHYNIADAVLRSAAARHLDATATGGNCDYIIRQLSGEMIMVLASGIDSSSPDTLDEKAVVSLKLTEDWVSSVEFYFDTTVKALDFMAAFESSDTTNCENLNEKA
jgi:hypothetical protein